MAAREPSDSDPPEVGCDGLCHILGVGYASFVAPPDTFVHIHDANVDHDTNISPRIVPSDSIQHILRREDNQSWKLPTKVFREVRGGETIHTRVFCRHLRSGKAWFWC